MIAGIGRRGGALLLVPLTLAGFGFVPLARNSGPTPTPPPTPAYAPPPAEESPFSSPDAFCVPSENRFASIAPNDPSLRANPVSAVLLTPAGSASSELASEAATFATLINRCGGIGGRRFDLRVVSETGNPATDCLAATTPVRPLVVVSLAALAAERCIVHDQQTIVVTESDASNADLSASSGRLVATGSSEGTERARLLDLVSSGRLDGRAVAIVAGTGPGDVAFVHSARAALAARRIRPVDPRRATAVLEPTLDIASVPLLTTATAATRRRQPLDIYGLAPATGADLQQVRQLSGGAPGRPLQTANLFAFAPPTDPAYRASRAPNTFSEMCNQAYTHAASTSTSAPTTTSPSDAPLSASYLRISDVCLALRTVARGVFAAGPATDPTALVSAFHRLPYLDEPAPGGTPKPRPNQIVNEPVTRIAQVVVLTQVRHPCPSPASTPDVVDATCWAPVSGWDDGGKVVNVPLPAATTRLSH